MTRGLGILIDDHRGAREQWEDRRWAGSKERRCRAGGRKVDEHAVTAVPSPYRATDRAMGSFNI
jgi:hypothetical protein